MKFTGRRIITYKTLTLLLLVLVCNSQVAFGESCKIAVASNFANTAKTLSKMVEQESGNTVLLSFGSSGKLYTQIKNGAPYDAFLSADDVRPRLLVEEGLALSSSLVTYANGLLVLWSPKTPINTKTLSDIPRIALANPKTAPYGAAAIHSLRYFDYVASSKSKLIYGENVAQAMQFVSSGNSNAAFISLSQFLLLPEAQRGFWWQVNELAYPELKQQAVLLKGATHNTCAIAFLDNLKTIAGRKIIVEGGYALP